MMLDAAIVGAKIHQRNRQLHRVMLANEQFVWLSLSDKRVGDRSHRLPASTMTV
jgi:hypothetical protein